MANIVLVHGAWHGAWCYRDTAAALRKMGHFVVTPSHTGVGERAHQSGEAITLETHIRDVIGYIEAEEIKDIILVGHSYGGMIITGVAERVPEKIKALVYLDAFVPENGDSLISLLNAAHGPEVGAQMRNGMFDAARVHGGLMPPFTAEMFNVTESKRAWVDRRCVPQALATFQMPVLLSGKGDAIKKRLYILADGWDPSPFRHFAAKMMGKPGWDVIKMPCGHDVMVDMPNELAAALAKLA
jgi:pimeloyl-ACP methyl ester carboxylesterase